MKDFLQKYKNKKIIWNIYIILSAFLMAFFINFLVIDWTNIWNNLKTSILESWINYEKKADIYLEKKDKQVFLKNSKEIKNTKNISFSIVYDNSNTEVLEIKSNIWKVDYLWEKWSWIETIIINIENKDIKKDENIAEIIFNKKEDKSSQINIINWNFTDIEENIFNLTSSWTSI